jgi:hypothetical protein
VGVVGKGIGSENLWREQDVLHASVSGCGRGVHGASIKTGGLCARHSGSDPLLGIVHGTYCCAAAAANVFVCAAVAGWVSGGSTGPGKPEGGEALGLRALWAFLQQRYSKQPAA